MLLHDPTLDRVRSYAQRGAWGGGGKAIAFWSARAIMRRQVHAISMWESREALEQLNDSSDYNQAMQEIKPYD
jgi:hypothetical protein